LIGLFAFYGENFFTHENGALHKILDIAYAVVRIKACCDAAI
jgi:hypothetical protein